MTLQFTKIKDANDKEAARIFQEKVLSQYVPTLHNHNQCRVSYGAKRYPPIFHEWFLDTFSEPSAWLSSRLAYGRTAAVMSIVGFILGCVLTGCLLHATDELKSLGDRHLENILLDINSGDVVHVDFNCLFEKVCKR